MDLSQYSLKTLHQDGEFILYRSLRATKAHTSSPSFLALSPVMERPAPATIKKLEHEFSLKDELDAAWAVRPIELTHQPSRTMLTFEDPGGEPLDRFPEQPTKLQEFLRCGIALASAIGQVHRRGLVHKDIKPSNVLANAARDQVWLMGFGIASRLPRERQRAEPPEFISGTLAYMAPEQTGRMNRSIDSRSDLYSLGITLYELLTGTLPFAASDPMEWVHCHIARQPSPPTERLRDIPRPISAIIMKLLAKTPEDRYQTAAGVESDLHRCLEDWDRDRGVHDFELGEHDRPDHLQIPEKLYGREREIELLLAGFDRVVKYGTPEFVLISGYSGIGKTSVVNELHKALVPRGLFASGKFDRYKRDIPYSTLGQALQGLIGRLLLKSEAELAIWRDAMREALEPNGRLMIDLVPELKIILGEQPPVPELPPQDAERRFRLVFRRFIGVFARPEHPLALFLDDLQWLDSATLEALEDLLTQGDVQHLFLIGAYRDNEVDAAHPLTRKLEDIFKAGARINEIKLSSLSQKNVAQLIADALHSAPERSSPLAQLIYNKTAGNPFFTLQFLSALEQERLLVFDHTRGSWSWDVDRIHAKRYTDNVVDLMVGKLRRLPPEAQKALQQLAVLGNSAESPTLSLALQMPEEEVHAALWEAMRQEVVEYQDGCYRFIHDRVQEAAYSLIPETSRAEAHLRIGRLLVSHTAPDKREETIFDIVNQLNRGASLITAREEKEKLAEFNLIAGKRAKASTAYASALNYLLAGAAVLGDDGWERRRDLIFALEVERAECEFLTGELAAADERLTVLSNRAANTVERALIACLHMDVCTTLDQSERAVAVALEYLRHVGIDWLPHPTEDEARREYEQIWVRLGSRRIEDVVDLPPMTDPESLAAVEVLTKLEVPALFTDRNLDSLTICRAVNLSLERGNCDASCLAYITFGRIAGPRFGDYQAAFRFGHVGLVLVENRGLKRFQASAYDYFAIWIARWMKHVRSSVDLLRRAFEAANKIGDLTFAAYASVNLNSDLLFAGDPLSEVQREAELGLAFSRRARFGLITDGNTAQLALIRTLRGLTSKFGRFDSELIDELTFERHLAGNSAFAIAECWYWIRKLQARYFAGEYEEAMEASLRAQRLLWTSSAFFEEAEYHFYSALSRAACCGVAPAHVPPDQLESLAAHHRQLEIWAKNCPDNFENRAALVGAEIARIEGRDLDAMRLYENAIHSARRNGFIHNEAVAYERASTFYRARGYEQFADTYLRNARACYASWGADGKVRQLDRLHPTLKQEPCPPTATSTITEPVEGLDLATLIRVSQAVSGEIVLEKLLDTVMRKAMEHAGAERGLLIVPRGDALQIEAESKTSEDDVIVHLGDADADAAALPKSIIRYVIRTHESVILDDASSENPFSADPYIVHCRVHSVLCLPLLNQAKLMGVLYLENNLAARVFTPDRITVLKVLVSQAAISLENTRLYRDLEDREAKIRRLVDANILGIFIWNLEGAIVGSNEAFLRMLQYSREDLVSGRVRWTDLTPEEWRGSDERAREVLTAIGTVQPYEKEYLRKDGTRVPVLVGAALFTEGGTDGVAFVLDLSQQKRAEAEIRELKDQLYKENLALRDEVERVSMFDEIVGTSKPLKVVLSRIAKVAPTDSTVLITGETGTGKELVARAIHKKSRRSARAFVSVNCAAIPRDLIPSELFGHEKGAFTGATQRRLGRFELADGGTIFLDEVGELLPDTQVALLRVLQERELERVGGGQSIHVDVRVLAATNRDLEAAVSNGTFRQDLFYRLNVFPIEVPSLRERKDDLLLLVEYFVQCYATKAGKDIRSIDKKTMDLLQSYDWPGNIRELQNVIERSVILSSGDVFSVDELWLRKELLPAASRAKTSPVVNAQVEPFNERQIIEAALAATRGRVSGPSGAATKLGIPPSTLETRIKALKIVKSQFKFR